MLIGSYSSFLVAASLFVAILVSYTALGMAGRISSSAGNYANAWLAGGAFTMGLGIWSMHFIGMLAFRLPIDVGYDALLTLTSFALAVICSAFALWVTDTPHLSLIKLAIGASLMGGGIAAMHYLGMAAMKMTPAIVYDWRLVTTSVVVAILSSAGALWLTFTLKHQTTFIFLRRCGSALIMGTAISGMHYLGMASAGFPEGSFCGAANQGISAAWLSLALIAINLSVIGAALLISIFDETMEQRTTTLSTSLALANNELLQLALYDPLTRLANRTLLNETLERALKDTSGSDVKVAILFLGLDGFKPINDAYGRCTGDQVLIGVAERIKCAVRPGDTVARLGGDEFVVMASILRPADASMIARQIIDSLKKQTITHNHQLVITASIGIAIYPDDAKDRHELMVHADSAMYYAKERGRNDYQFFERSMYANAQQNLELLLELRQAVHRGELELYYQPKFSAPAGPIVGAEALIRWRHPVRGLICPVDFLTLAEKSGLIIAIGDWALNEACRQLRCWHESGHLDWGVAVNLSAIQLNHPGLRSSVETVLKKNNIAPESLTLEITESLAMKDISSSVKVLNELSAAGVCISIDDFGTGHSSLMYLKQLPAKEIKIDKGFLDTLSEGTDDTIILSKIIELAKMLDMRVVAEGVETVEQQRALTSMGCDILQGFLLGHPMTADELTQRGAPWLDQVMPDR
ncbi:EAL domain-containing protein [Pseudomonas entomophila]|uniref:putative bifunctional diguanylate cyclase/phosphodiesterase n=1 Tax=Pseudomonas entomophila TaxID=312306 RepID=UPI0023D7CC55|nr:EAL domain-containing protein [Pseudomonas entomophila]MDF0733630.1 EAL domain-containing protein [Pseudomonas entomophila]